MWFGACSGVGGLISSLGALFCGGGGVAEWSLEASVEGAWPCSEVVGGLWWVGLTGGVNVLMLPILVA